MKVFLNGAFDVLHVLHFNQLMKARLLAGEHGMVYVGLDTDAKIQKDKGLQRPIFPLSKRIEALLAIEHPFVAGKNLIDEIFVFDTNRELHDLVKKLDIDIMIKGSDWEGNIVGADFVKNLTLIKRDERFSSTNIINTIIKKYER